MEPQIRYATSRDGVRIAFWAIGAGYPLVQLPSPLGSHLEKEWHSAEFRAWYEGLGKTFTVIRYDGRGLGLSDRDFADLSMSAATADLDAVVSSLGLRSFAIFAPAAAAPVAIEYAARHETVSHLILWHAVARSSEFFDSPERQSLLILAKADWKMYSLTAASAYRGWIPGEDTRGAASILEATNPDFFFRMLEAQRRFDATSALPSVKARTLVLHRRDYTGIDMGISCRLASTIPGARLEILNGSSGLYLMDEAVLETVKAFIEDGAALTQATASTRIDDQQETGLLTPREAQVIRLVVNGLTSAEVALRLGISVHTVERHLANVYEKRGVHSRVELVLQVLNESHAEHTQAGV